MVNPASSKKGKVIFNSKYELVDLIDQGAAGDVYLGKSLNPDDEQ